MIDVAYRQTTYAKPAQVRSLVAEDTLATSTRTALNHMIQSAIADLNPADPSFYEQAKCLTKQYSTFSPAPVSSPDFFEYWSNPSMKSAFVQAQLDSVHEQIAVWASTAPRELAAYFAVFCNVTSDTYDTASDPFQ